ncbi:MAG: hypothetical protein HY898_29180 [Deltaproteobacteria bacterium]|nr:hypothetical protein [Deltaproteobacteria bacterium]
MSQPRCVHAIPAASDIPTILPPKHLQSWLVGVLALLAAIGQGCGSEADATALPHSASKPVGSPGGACFPNGTCYAGLECDISGICVGADAGASDAKPADASGENAVQQDGAAADSTPAEAAPVDPTCADKVKNGKESDVDCGGGFCPPCDQFKGCVEPSDCSSGICSSGLCAVDSCASQGSFEEISTAGLNHDRQVWECVKMARSRCNMTGCRREAISIQYGYPSIGVNTCTWTCQRISEVCGPNERGEVMIDDTGDSGVDGGAATYCRFDWSSCPAGWAMYKSMTETWQEDASNSCGTQLTGWHEWSDTPQETIQLQWDSGWGCYYGPTYISSYIGRIGCVCKSPDLTAGESGPDAGPGGVSWTCVGTAGEQVTLSTLMCNRGTDTAPVGTPLTFFLGDPSDHDVLCTAVTSAPLVVNDCVLMTCDAKVTPGATMQITAAANDPGTGSAPYPECLLRNNVKVVSGVQCNASQ